MKEKQSVQYVVRLTSELASRVDAYAERLRVEQPGLSVSKSDVVRVLLTRALDAVCVSADAKPKAAKKK